MGCSKSRALNKVISRTRALVVFHANDNSLSQDVQRMSSIIAGRHDDFATAYTRCNGSRPRCESRHLDKVARIAHHRRLHLLVAEAGALESGCPRHRLEIIRFTSFCVSADSQPGP